METMGLSWEGGKGTGGRGKGRAKGRNRGEGVKNGGRAVGNLKLL